MRQLKSDKSIVSSSGKTLFFSHEDFKNKIMTGDVCFICGATRAEKEFNDEHILSDWILREYSLYARRIELPNGTDLKYGGYKVPCCKPCNSWMGNHFENPISVAVTKGFDAFKALIEKQGQEYLFNWLLLIFFKTHFKDYLLPNERNTTKGDKTNIGENHTTIESLHEIHCLARSFHTEAKWDNVVGTLIYTKATEHSEIESFDYMDDYPTRTVMIRLGGIVIFTSFNDSETAMRELKRTYISKIDGPLNPMQAKELFARISYVNWRMNPHIRFTNSIGKDGKLYIDGTWDKPLSLKPQSDPEQGMRLVYFCSKLAGYENLSTDAKQRLRVGKYTFLLDSQGEFLKEGVIIKKPESGT